MGQTRDNHRAVRAGWRRLCALSSWISRQTQTSFCSRYCLLGSDIL